jgi:hypothetical protein
MAFGTGIEGKIKETRRHGVQGVARHMSAASNQGNKYCPELLELLGLPVYLKLIGG